MVRLPGGGAGGKTEAGPGGNAFLSPRETGLSDESPAFQLGEGPSARGSCGARRAVSGEPKHVRAPWMGAGMWERPAEAAPG